MATPRHDTSGPFIVWLDYGYEGWHPRSYDSLKDAVEGERYGEEFCVTQRVEYEIKVVAK